MAKINLGLFLLIIAILILGFLYFKTDKNYMFIKDELEVINSKLDHLEYDLHELEDK